MTETKQTLRITVTNPEEYCCQSYAVEVATDADLDEMVRVLDGILHCMGYIYDGYLKVEYFPSPDDVEPIAVDDLRIPIQKSKNRKSDNQAPYKP